MDNDTNSRTACPYGLNDKFSDDIKLTNNEIYFELTTTNYYKNKLHKNNEVEIGKKKLNIFEAWKYKNEKLE